MQGNGRECKIVEVAYDPNVDAWLVKYTYINVRGKYIKRNKAQDELAAFMAIKQELIDDGWEVVTELQYENEV